jgi:hypothetical protein
MGMCRNIQALARLILPDEFGVRSLTNDVATPTTPKSLNFGIAATHRVCCFHWVTDLSNVRDPPGEAIRGSCSGGTRSTPSLVFFTIVLIGVLGFSFDYLMRCCSTSCFTGHRRARKRCVASTGSGRSRQIARSFAATWPRPGLPAPRARTKRCAGSISTSRQASSSRSSGLRAAASRPCSICSPASRRRRRDKSGRLDSQSGARRRNAA